MKDLWIVGDYFLFEVFPNLQASRAQAAANKTSPPYLYQYYNVSAFYKKTLSPSHEGVSRLLNSFIEGLNSKEKFPKYAPMIPDVDIIDTTDYFDFGAGIIFDSIMSWLFKQLTRAVNRRTEDIIYKRPGAVASTREPWFIWVKAIQRPNIRDRHMKMTMSLRKKFNDCLDALIA